MLGDGAGGLAGPFPGAGGAGPPGVWGMQSTQLRGAVPPPRAALTTSIWLKTRHEVIINQPGGTGAHGPLGAGSCPCRGLTGRFFPWPAQIPWESQGKTQILLVFCPGWHHGQPHPGPAKKPHKCPKDYSGNENQSIYMCIYI